MIGEGIDASIQLSIDISYINEYRQNRKKIYDHQNKNEILEPNLNSQHANTSKIIQLNHTFSFI